MNYEDIYIALYILNKSAKKSRDTSVLHESDGIIKRSRKRKNKIYKLKHAVMDKLYKENKIELKGIHEQKSKNDTCFHLTYFKSPSGWSYHRPSTKEELNSLTNNKIEEMTIVPAFKNRDIKMTYQKAIDLCCEYLGIKESQIIYLKKKKWEQNK